MSVVFIKCSNTALWSSEPCPPDCDGEHEECLIGDANIAPTIAKLLNVVDSVCGDLLDGDSGDAIEKLETAHREATGYEMWY